MISVVLIGSGNVAQHMIKAISKATDLDLVQVVARKPETIAHLLALNKITAAYEEMIMADVYLIAVSDNAIGEVSAKFPFKNRLVAHTSGSFPMYELNSKNRKAVFYPLQTFSKNKEINFKEVPICLEAENVTDLILLKKMASSLSDKVFEIDSIQRKSLHVSAVFVSNFVNHLYAIGSKICAENKVPFDILKPLIKETASKIETISPNEAQTGPAKRKDTETITTHLKFLSDENQKNIYKILTKSIIDNGTKL